MAITLGALTFLQPTLASLPEHEPLTILDFGAGQSRVPELLRKRGHRVIAVDIVPPRRPHPDRFTGDILQLELPVETFDLIYSFQVFEHLPTPVPILHRLLELVKLNGYLLIHTDMETPERASGFTNWWYVTPPDHCIFYRHRTFELFLADTEHELVLRAPKYVLIQKGARSGG